MNISDVLEKMEKIRDDVPMTGQFAEDGRDVWPERWKRLLEFLSSEQKVATVKLAVHISDFGAAMHVGGPVEDSTVIVEVESAKLADLMKLPEKGKFTHCTRNISIVREG